MCMCLSTSCSAQDQLLAMFTMHLKNTWKLYGRWRQGSTLWFHTNPNKHSYGASSKKVSESEHGSSIAPSWDTLTCLFKVHVCIKGSRVKWGVTWANYASITAQLLGFSCDPILITLSIVCDCQDVCWETTEVAFNSREVRFQIPRYGWTMMNSFLPTISTNIPK